MKLRKARMPSGMRAFDKKGKVFYKEETLRLSVSFSHKNRLCIGRLNAALFADAVLLGFKQQIDNAHHAQRLLGPDDQFFAAIQHGGNVVVIIRPVGVDIGQRQFLCGFSGRGAMVRVGPASV